MWRRLTVMALLSMAAQQAAAQGAAGLERGRAIAQARCSVCHAVSERDASPHRITPPFRELHERFPVEMLEDALRTNVISGHDEMPMFELEPADMRALIGYIDSLAPGRPGYLTRSPR